MVEADDVPQIVQAIGVGRERLGQHFQRHVPVELRVAGLIHLAHAALADLGDDGVRAEGRTGFERHQLLRVIGELGGDLVDAEPVAG